MLDQARQTLRMEAQAIERLADRLDGSFEAAVRLILSCRGRIVVTGMGKSGLVGQKIAATLASTGTPSFFLHPAEGSHGDLGMVMPQDVVILLSNSGETQEVIALVPVFKRMGVPMVALVGGEGSTLARMSEIFLDVSVEKEACPMGLAPTCSTTAALAMGDALAVTLLEQRGFGPEQFAFFHPGGSLGKKLLLKVADRMHTGDRVPLVQESDRIREAMLEMSAKRFGMTGVVDEAGDLVGVLTDGDLRRNLEREEGLLSMRVGEIMTKNPHTIWEGALAVEAIKWMEEKKITALFVLTESGRLAGVIHLHDLLEAGLM
ncbi:MAG: KpsF/GutQ family sugar-phosphate isomerase [Magnetococcales bacterium]|nr:KpsF/GutQ family sugar-phosphate isomerase [Magnetococcales bacterium]